MGKRSREEANGVTPSDATPSAKKIRSDETQDPQVKIDRAAKHAARKAEKVAIKKEKARRKAIRVAKKKAAKVEAKKQKHADKAAEKQKRKDALNTKQSESKQVDNEHPEKHGSQSEDKQSGSAIEEDDDSNSSADSSLNANAELDSSAAPSKGASSVTSPEPETTISAVENVGSSKAAPNGETGDYLASNNITIHDPSNTEPLPPMRAFSDLPLTDEGIKATLTSFTHPTPIQAAAWPWLFNGRDVIGVAETGSGKTLAFGLPCVGHLLSLRDRGEKVKGPGAVIVSPTRELALQIQEQLIKVATPVGLKVSCIYGGVQKDDQRVALKKSQIIVATPGRLNDLLSEEGAKGLKKAKFLVLDEADRMLDKGFEDDIRKIVSATAPPNERQTLMFTATWPPSVRELAATFMTQPVRINIGDNPDGELRANTRIAQTVEVVNPRDKEYRLLQLLKQHQSGKQKDDRILVFCLYKKEATRVENFIRSKGFRVAGIHGDLSQAQRIASLSAFKEGKVPLLVATDVAARGLDIPAVKLVINVTFPLTAEDYVHRIGRTGRAGKEGKAITLFTENDKALSGA